MDLPAALLLCVLTLVLAALPTSLSFLLLVGLATWVSCGRRGWHARPTRLYILLLVSGFVHWSSIVPALQRRWGWTPLRANGTYPADPTGFTISFSTDVYLNDLDHAVDTLLHNHRRLLPPTSHPVDSAPLCPPSTPDLGRLFGDRFHDVRNSCVSGKEACRTTLTALHTDTLAYLIEDSKLPRPALENALALLTRVTTVLRGCCDQCG